MANPLKKINHMEGVHEKEVSEIILTADLQ